MPDANASDPQYSIRHSSNSSSSAVDLSGTGLGVVVPQSPALRPSDTGERAYARRRLSWSNTEARQDSPRLDIPSFPEPGPSNLTVFEEDAHFFSVDGFSRNDSPLYATSHPLADASFTSLRSTSDSDADTVRDDDETRLTGKAQLKVDGSRDLPVDSERSAGMTPRSRRRYTTPSPLQRTGTAIKNALRRTSTRVANVRGHRPSIRLREGDADSDSTSDGMEETTRHDVGERAVHLQSIPLRGRALGFLGPTNPLRLRLYYLLIHPYAYFPLSLHSLR